jgi:nifR3 family TIM-barrel protein
MNPDTHLLKRHESGCPRLFLAPMEGVGDRPFRKAMSLVGGFDEASTEFIRVPVNAHVESLARVYDPLEIYPLPLAAQVMGSSVELVAQMGIELEKRGAHRIDLNCGCPSNTVTGKGAGSSLLKTPDLLHEIGKALVKAVKVPVTIKMRSGYDDTSLFFDNLKAAEETGASFITLHPRTKKDGYVAKANWELIKEAKSFLKTPLIGNGDIKNVDDALNMLNYTKCDALMIGRGAVRDPFIFKKIKGHFSSTPFQASIDDYALFLKSFLNYLSPDSPSRTKGNKLKQILGFIFDQDPQLQDARKQMLRLETADPLVFLDNSLLLLEPYL